MAEVVQQAVTETSREAISQRQERPAFQPNISLPEDEKEIEQIFSGSADLAYTMSFEVLPKFDTMDFGLSPEAAPRTLRSCSAAAISFQGSRRD
jgi:trigger factor